MNNPMAGKKYMTQSMGEKTDENTSVEETKETKKLLGYDCKKYIVKTKAQGTDATMILYVAEDLVNFDSQTQFGGKIKGMPLLTEVTAMQMGAEIKVKKEVSEIKKEKVSDDKFDMTIPEGYEKTDPAMLRGGPCNFLKNNILKNQLVKSWFFLCKTIQINCLILSEKLYLLVFKLNKIRIVAKNID